MSGHGHGHTGSRRKPADTRTGVCYSFTLGEYAVEVATGEYEDGSLCEIFVSTNSNDTLAAVMDSWATMVSIALQYGVPLGVLAEKMEYHRFEPQGPTGNPRIPQATSIVDHIGRWLRQTYLGHESFR